MVKELNKIKMLEQLPDTLTPQNVTLVDIQSLRLGGKRSVAGKLIRDHAQYMEEERKVSPEAADYDAKLYHKLVKGIPKV